MSNVARTLAMTINTTFTAKYRPGQILSDSGQKTSTLMGVPQTNLRPEPNTLFSGSGTEGSIFPSLARNLSGLNACESG